MIPLQAQTNLDSLYAVWQDESQPDSNRVKAINDYIRKGVMFSDPDSAFNLAEDLMTFGEQRTNLHAKLSALGMMGMNDQRSRALEIEKKLLEGGPDDELKKELENLTERLSYAVNELKNEQ